MKEIEAFNVDLNVSSPVNVNVTPTPETPTPQALGDSGITLKQPLNPQPKSQETIDWLLGLGLPPLPVAPAQDPHTYPLLNKKGEVVFEKDGVTPKAKFTGKNPSYLDLGGIPHTVSHGKYQKRQPTEDELKAWFANPLNGVGSLGSDKWAFVDLDRHKFDAPELTPEQSQQACDEAGERIIHAAEAETSKLPPYEKTQSFGWRVVVGLSKPPTFTNFCLTPGGDHVGEVLGKGRFAVLAPTIGPSGNAYVAYHRCPPDEIPIVDSLEDIGLYPTGAKSKPKAEPPTLPLEESAPTDTPVNAGEDASETPSTDTPVNAGEDASDRPLDANPPHTPTVVGGGTIPLRAFGSKDSRNILKGTNVENDNSASLTLAYREWCGWENWLGRYGSKIGVYFSESAESLAHEAGNKLGITDPDRVDRILKGIDASSCTPGIYSFEGDSGCLKKVRAIAKKYGVKVDGKIAPLHATASAKDSPNEGDRPPKTPSPKKIAEALAEDYRHRWKYWAEKKYWMEFDGKVWRSIDDEVFVSNVWQLLKSKGIEWELPVYIENVVKSLKNELIVKKWQMWDRKRYIAFSDKVLDNETGELLTYTPGMGFLSHLPYKYAELPSTTNDPIEALRLYCPKLFNFMNRAMGGSQKRILKLLAIINGAIKFRFFDLQYFVHLVGKPGTGKGTFARILGQIIGDENSANSTIASLDEPTEMAALIDKQLVTCPDERKQHGIETLLRLTGGDKFRYREIYKPRGEGFFYALLLVLSNTPIFSGEVTGLKRRICLVEFVNPITKNLRDTKAEREQSEEIPSLIPIALMLNDDQVTSLIKGLGNDEIPEFKRQEWELQIQVSPLAAWINEWLIHDSSSELAVGDGAFEPRGEGFNRSYDTTTAYGNYLNHCRVTGVTRPLTRNTFSPTLERVCNEELEWDDVKRKRNKRGAVFQGLRLREDGDSAPWVEETFEAQGVHRCTPGVDPGVDLKRLPSKGGVDYVDQKALMWKNEEEMLDAVNAMSMQAHYEKFYGVSGVNWDVISANNVARLEQAFTQSAGDNTPIVNEENEDDTPIVNEKDENEASTPPTHEETIEMLASETTPSTPALPGKGFGSTPTPTPGVHRCTPDDSTLTPNSNPETPIAPTQKRNLNANYRYCGKDKMYGSTMLCAGTLLKIISDTADPEIFIVNVIGGNGEKLEVKYEDLLWTEKDNQNG